MAHPLFVKLSCQISYGFDLTTPAICWQLRMIHHPSPAGRAATQDGSSDQFAPPGKVIGVRLARDHQNRHKPKSLPEPSVLSERETRRFVTLRSRCCQSVQAVTRYAYTKPVPTFPADNSPQGAINEQLESSEPTRHFDGVPIHMSMADACRSISSRLTNAPRPAPGQTCCVSLQVSTVARFDFQNGQERHCRGRAA